MAELDWRYKAFKVPTSKGILLVAAQSFEDILAAVKAGEIVPLAESNSRDWWDGQLEGRKPDEVVHPQVVPFKAPPKAAEEAEEAKVEGKPEKQKRRLRARPAVRKSQ